MMVAVHRAFVGERAGRRCEYCHLREEDSGQVAFQVEHIITRRVSFVDALRWLRQARPGEPLPRLVVNPDRPEPRVRKRRPKQFPVMKRPRHVLREEILRQNLAA